MLPIALVRRTDISIWDEEELEDEITRQADLIKPEDRKKQDSAAEEADPSGAAQMGAAFSNPFCQLAATALANDGMVDLHKILEFREKWSRRTDGEFYAVERWKA